MSLSFLQPYHDLPEDKSWVTGTCDPLLYSLVLRTESVWSKHRYTFPYSPKASNLSNACSLTVKVEINFIIYLLNLSIF